MTHQFQGTILALIAITGGVLLPSYAHVAGQRDKAHREGMIYEAERMAIRKARIAWQAGEITYAPKGSTMRVDRDLGGRIHINIISAQ